MPANLPPEYQKAEAVYRSASGPEEKIEALQEMLRVIPHHKGTDKLIAQHRKKLSQLRDETQRRTATSRKGTRVHVPKEGAAQVALVGMPNAGKSNLVRNLTRATPEVAAYPYTTLMPTPGMMPYLNIWIQLVDTPPVTFEGAKVWLPNILKGADAMVPVLNLAGDPLAELDRVLSILKGWKVFFEGMEEAFDAEPGFGKVLKPVLILANQVDAEGTAERIEILKERTEGRFPLFAVSAEEGTGLEDWKPELFSRLRILRAYTKSPGKDPDLDDPVILRAGGTVEDFAESIHKDVRKGLKHAKIWGSSKFDGQKVTRDYVLQDEDIVEVHT